MFWYSLQLLSKVFLILGKLQRRDRNVHLSSHKLPAILVRVWGTGWCSWLRHCATSRKVAGSIPDDVIGILHWHNASCRTMALGSTRPLTETSTRNISWGVKAAGAYGWQPYHLHVPIVLKSGSLNLLQPSGPVQACNGIALPLPLHSLQLTTLTINYPQQRDISSYCRLQTCTQKYCTSHGGVPSTVSLFYFATNSEFAVNKFCRETFWKEA